MIDFSLLSEKSVKLKAVENGGFTVTDENDVLVFPITGWHIGPLSEHGAILMQFDFITSPLQPTEESLETNLFCLTPAMAHALIAQLSESIKQLAAEQANAAVFTRH